MTKTNEKQPNILLKKARLEKGWSQQEVANFIGVPQTFMISRWESGTTIPNPVYRDRLCELFGKKPPELGFPEAAIAFNSIAINFHQPLYDPAIPLRLSNRSTVIGRNLLLKQLKSMICDEKETRLVALNGLPGVGKTSLALALVSDPEIRTHFYDGIFWAGLGPTSHLLAHFNRWGRLLSLSEQERSRIRHEQEWINTLRALLSTRRMLIVIDDVWALEDALRCTVGGEQCTYLLTTRMAEIATSFAEKQAIHVPELQQEESIQLLSQLLPTAITETALPAMHQLVQAVGGLPLALNLLGTYLLRESRYHQPRRIQAALQRILQAETRFQISQPKTEPVQHALPSQQIPLSLRATISLSIANLHASARQALFALSTFPAKPNSFSEEAALAIADVEADILDHLVDIGLLEAQREDRYQLHQVIADYAHLYLADEGQKAVVEERMVHYWLRQTINQEAISGSFKAFEEETENILQAFEFAYNRHMPDLLIQGALSYYPVLKYQGMFQQLEQVLTRAKEAAVLNGPPINCIKLLLYLAQTQKLRGDYHNVENNAREGLRLLGEHCPQEYQLYQALLIQLILVGILLGNYETAKSLAQTGIEATHANQSTREFCILVRLMGIIAEFQGDILQAQSYWHKALNLARKLDDTEELIHALGVLGAGSARQERYTEAKLYIYEGLQLAQNMGDFAEISNFHLDLGDIALIQNENTLAESHLQQALLLARRMQLHPTLSVALATLGELELKRNHDKLAEAYLSEGLALSREKGNNDFIGIILTIQTELYLRRQDIQAAEKTVTEALAIIPAGNKLYIATAHYYLARVLFAQGQRKQAQKQAILSCSIFEEIGNSKAQEVRVWLEEHCKIGEE